ncbi:family 16 glycoside hydrolase [Croceivirga thetidis]|uniref:DUF1080 domain-containing protein n=1 Tax=Croceivirga thetidis TaxID=2721623 RepID=A0ABX1GN80_9FLAO|nr:family 16 glycoside hydrolase [Croceivirga thetidis]NKI31094.1 DUF1080 domain-containing protein [Croceivirga thetidis]
MKKLRLLAVIIAIQLSGTALAQTTEPLEADQDHWTIHNREGTFENNNIHLNAQEQDGMAWLNDSEFTNGTLEFDVKGKNAPGRSFVGLAFHGQGNETFDAVYFRPFNFKNPEKKANAVQYISIPGGEWFTLRENSPGTYESEFKPTPESVEDWFHVKIEIAYPQVKVYVNDSTEPTLVVNQLSEQKSGQVGFWVGNNSEGWFKNLNIQHHED